MSADGQLSTEIKHSGEVETENKTRAWPAPTRRKKKGKRGLGGDSSSLGLTGDTTAGKVGCGQPPTCKCQTECRCMGEVEIT